jgi:hypothetical protein
VRENKTEEGQNLNTGPKTTSGRIQ